MSQRVSLVTGGASGIGRATALRLAAACDTVIVADLNADGGAETVRRIAANGGSARFEHLDVADEASVAALAAKTGPIHNLINCAGILQNANRVEDMDLAEHDRLWAINYRGTYLCCRAWGGIIAKAGGGCIVNIGSIAGKRMFPVPAYSPSKMAIHGLTEELAADLGPRGVRVNAVAPGFVLTEALQARIDAGERDTSVMEAQTPLGRLMRPEDIAEGIHFLCSDAAAMITGIVLPIDGGWLTGVTYYSYAGLKKN
jgi:NAD(P)-dependent dehydrogenase (short-subunit alcohol dehydrogenase family)